MYFDSRKFAILCAPDTPLLRATVMVLSLVSGDSSVTDWVLRYSHGFYSRESHKTQHSFTIGYRPIFSQNYSGVPKGVSH